MDKNEIARHANELDALSHEEDGVEYWLARIPRAPGFVYAKSAFHAVTATNARTPNTHSHWTI
jgi:hypothetical protein